MKRRISFWLAMFFSLILGLSMVGCTTSPSATYSLPDLIGVWEGSYTAGQGETGLTLTVFEANGNYRAVFYFYNLPSRTNTAILPEGADGSYYMNVFSNHSTKKYNLVGYEWIKKPGGGWVFVDLEGIVHGNVFTGTSLVTEGGLGYGTPFSFRVVRK